MVTLFLAGCGVSVVGALRFHGEGLDFIINYDIKYRMGEGLESGKRHVVCVAAITKNIFVK
jgi:hypothetical protein